LKFVLPRVVRGNRGDIASRWGIINGLFCLGLEDVSIFCDSPKNVPLTPYPLYSYGKLHNLVFTSEGRKALKASDTVLWVGGHDIQDDSSLMKITYLWVFFRIFRVMGLRVWCLFQGVGPINTSVGRLIARGVLKVIDLFVARDSGSLQLLQEIYPRGKYIYAHDGIFMPDFEKVLPKSKIELSSDFINIFSNKDNIVIGFNIRMWFHFNSSLLPYHLRKKAYKNRSKKSMKELIASSCEVISKLRKIYNTKIVLISAYQPGVVSWEDDIPWLKQIKNSFHEDSEVILLDSQMTMPDYYKMMSSFDLVIAMRLHSTLTALRFGVPGINLSYTLKGHNILANMGLGDHVVSIEDFLISPESVLEKTKNILNNYDYHQKKNNEAVAAAIQLNASVMKDIFN